MAKLNSLLTCPIGPQLLRFALPNLGALLAAATATIAETALAGHLGVDALAGLALVFPFVMLQGMCSAGAIGGGVASAISRALGAGQKGKADGLVMHSLLIALVAGLAYCLLMLLAGPSLYRLLGGQGQALVHAQQFGQVAFVAGVAMWLLNILLAILRGTGNMVVPAVVLLLATAVQVLVAAGLSLGWWVHAWPWLNAWQGMRGIAAGQLVAFSLAAACLWRFLRQGRVAVQFKAGPVQVALLGEILRVGAVACLSPLQTVLTILIVTRLVAQFGTEALAGYGIGSRLEFLVVPMAFAVGVASVPLVGMAIGAGLVARARKVARMAAGLAFVGLTALGVVVALWPKLWTHWFTQDPVALSAAATYFAWVGPCYGLFGVGLSLYFSSLGAGQPWAPVLAGTLRLAVAAVGGLALLRLHAPFAGMFALVALAMALYGVATVWLVRRSKWGVPKPPIGNR